MNNNSVYGSDFLYFVCLFVVVFLGSGLFTTKLFQKGSFLLEYRGVISRSAEYDRDDTRMDDDYVFHFSHNGVDYRSVYNDQISNLLCTLFSMWCTL